MDRADGLHEECKNCRNAKRNTSRGEKEREYERRYHATHREQGIAISRRSYWKHRERHVVEMRLRYQRNKAAHKKARRAWYLRNREKLIKEAAKWAKENRARRRIISLRGSHVRRAKKAGTTSTLTAVQWRAIKASYGNRCAYCGQKPKKLTMDHIIPFAKGGTHAAENVVPACGHCNFSKHVSAAPTFQPLLLT